MGIDGNLDFTNLSDREIAERLFNHFGKQLFYYGVKSWNFSEDDTWDILYDTLYKFINSYGGQTFSSTRQIESLIWTIFKNKLRDKYRQKKKKDGYYQEVPYPEETLSNGAGEHAEDTDIRWLKYSEQVLMEDKVEDPILSELEVILDELEDWERQLVISRANEIPYSQVEEMTGKSIDFLKVHYQRLKKRIAGKLEERIKGRGEAHG